MIAHTYIDHLIAAARKRGQTITGYRASADALNSIMEGDGASSWPKSVDNVPITHDAALDADGWRIVANCGERGVVCATRLSYLR